MEGRGGAWPLRTASSLVSRGDVDDVEDLFVARSVKRTRPIVARTQPLRTVLPEGHSFTQDAGVPQRSRGHGPHEIAKSSEAALSMNLMVRVMNCCRRDHLRHYFGAWQRLLHWSPEGHSFFSPSRSPRSPAPLRPPASTLRAHRAAAVADALRVGLPAAARRPSTCCALVLLRLAFTAFAAEVLAAEGEAAARRRSRSAQVLNLAWQLTAWGAQRSRLQLLLMLKGWREVAVGHRPNGLGRAGAAVSLLARQARLALMEQCMLRWRTLIAEGLAMQVLVMRERVLRADAECSMLRVEDERLRAETERCKLQADAAESRSSVAVGELRRRSQQEFAQLHEVQMELAKLRAAAVASTVPALHPEPASAAAYVLGRAAVSAAESPQAIATVACGMAACFTKAAAQSRVRLYLVAWRAVVDHSELVLTLASQCSDTNVRLLAGRALTAWRLAKQKSHSQVGALRIAQTVYSQHMSTLARTALRSWHGHIDRISRLVTPLSHRGDAHAWGGSPLGSPIENAPLYHSAVTRPRQMLLEESPVAKQKNSLLNSPVSLRPSPNQSLFTFTSPIEEERSASQIRRQQLSTSGVSALALAAAEIAAPALSSPSASFLESAVSEWQPSQASHANSSSFRFDSVVDRLMDGFSVEGTARPAYA